MSTPSLKSARLQALPPFLFDEIDRKKRERLAAGADVINLGVGDPDKPTPGFVVEEMNRSMRDLENQQYPAVGGGLKAFGEAAAEFMQRRFGAKVDPVRHIGALLGRKDGTAHLRRAVPASRNGENGGPLMMTASGAEAERCRRRNARHAPGSHSTWMSGNASWRTTDVAMRMTRWRSVGPLAASALQAACFVE